MKLLHYSIFRAAGLTLALLGAGAPALADATVEAVLDNGLKVVVKPDRRAPVAVSQVWYKVGSLDEVSVPTGLSHALEHMMFKGTPAVPAGEFSRRVAAVGGKENAFTSRDYTTYFQQVRAESLPAMFKLEADRMANLSIDPQAFANEMKVIQEERRMRVEDQPVGALMEAVAATAFTASTDHHPVIGWMSDLEKMSADDLRGWYRRFYAPNNATLVVVGDVDPAAVLAAARDTFGTVARREVGRLPSPPEAAQDGVRRVTVKKPSELAYLMLAWRVPRLERVDARDPYALSVLAALLGGVDAARLPKSLVRERQLAVDVGASYDMDGRGQPLFSVSAALAKGRTPAELERALRAEIEAVAQHGVGERELKRVRTQLAAGRIYERDSMFAQAMNIGQLESRGYSWRDDDEMNRRLAAVTSADVRRVARQWLQTRNLTVGYLEPLPLAAGQGPVPLDRNGGANVR